MNHRGLARVRARLEVLEAQLSAIEGPSSPQEIYERIEPLGSPRSWDAIFEPLLALLERFAGQPILAAHIGPAPTSAGTKVEAQNLNS